MVARVHMLDMLARSDTIPCYTPISGSGSVRVMQIDKAALEALKKIHERKTGERLSDVEARDMGRRLIQIMKVIYRPLPKRGTTGTPTLDTSTPSSTMNINNATERAPN